MPISVLICDDSALARKQMARALPANLDAEIHFAVNGREAIDFITANKVDLMFLDLTMPVLDGYGTLTELQEKSIHLDIIVVSGDIQPQAQAKVQALGAKHFFKKPVTKEQVKDVFATFKQAQVTEKEVTADFLDEAIETDVPAQSIAQTIYRLPKLQRRDIYMEVANLAIGNAADSLARHFDVFVHLPLPNVNIFEISELHMTMRHLAANNDISGICQGFSGEGISGEALVLLSDSSIGELSTLMQYPMIEGKSLELELLMDVSNLLVGAFLKGLGAQAGVRFLQSCPELLGQHVPVDDLIDVTSGKWRRTMTFEVSYSIDKTNIKCDMLLMFVADSLSLLDKKLAYLLDDED